MKDYLKVYDVTLTVKGLLFIGSGTEISKKEYIRQGDYVYIIAIDRFYQEMKKRHLQKEYEQFMIQNNDSLEKWLREHRISRKDMIPFCKYAVAAGDAFKDVNDRKMQIMECEKDSYGNPYVPGSSIKGMLRTIFLANEIQKKSMYYQKNKGEIKREIQIGTDGKNLLKGSARKIETQAFHLLEREGTRRNDAVNDILSGLIVGDSDSVSVDELVMSQKIDMDIERKKRIIPTIRECIRPGTKIHFKLTIDSTICPYDRNDIEEMINSFSNCVYENFLIKFGSKQPQKNRVWLGGGCGYVSKTVTYNLFPGREGVEVVSRIMQKKTPRVHGHRKDKEYGVSPHMLKCGGYGGKKYQFGLCEWKFE